MQKDRADPPQLSTTVTINNNRSVAEGPSALFLLLLVGLIEGSQTLSGWVKNLTNINSDWTPVILFGMLLTIVIFLHLIKHIERFLRSIINKLQPFKDNVGLLTGRRGRGPELREWRFFRKPKDWVGGGLEKCHFIYRVYNDEITNQSVQIILQPRRQTIIQETKDGKDTEFKKGLADQRSRIDYYMKRSGWRYWYFRIRRFLPLHKSLP